MMQVISKSPLFDGFSPSALAFIASNARRRSFTANSTILRQGAPKTSLFIIVHGKIRVERTHSQIITPVVLDELRESDVFGAHGLLDASISESSYIAEDNTDVVELSGRAIALLLRDNFDDGRSLLNVVSQKICSLPELDRTIDSIFYKDLATYGTAFNVISQIDPLKHFSAAAIQALVEHSRYCHIPAGQSISMGALSGMSFYFVISGQLTVKYVLPDEQIDARVDLTPGSVLCDIHWLEHQRSELRASATEDVNMLEISVMNLLTILASDNYSLFDSVSTIDAIFEMAHSNMHHIADEVRANVTQSS